MQGQVEQEQKGGKRWAAFLALAALLVVAVAVIIYELDLRQQKPANAPEQSVLLSRVDELLGTVKKKVEAEKPLQIPETIVRTPRQEPEPPPRATVTREPTPQEVPAPAEGAQRTPAPMRTQPSPATPAAPVRLDLRGIIWRAADPLALINGSVVGVKEQVAGYTVISIAVDRVVLEDSRGQQRTLVMDDQRQN